MDRAFSQPTNWLRSGAQDAFAAVTSWTGDLWPGSDGRIGELEGENAALRAQLQAAQGDLLATQDQARQLSELSSLLNMPTPDNVERIVAPVTASDLSNFDSAIEIGKGTRDGVEVGMPVVTGAGLAGRVIQTSGSRSTVLLLNDTTFEVGVRFASTGDIAVAVGQGGGDLRVDLIDLDSAVGVGDVAVTSGQQNSRYPSGIPVGVVKTSEAAGRDLRRTTLLAAATDFQHLNNVAVLKWLPE